MIEIKPEATLNAPYAYKWSLHLQELQHEQ